MLTTPLRLLTAFGLVLLANALLLASPSYAATASADLSITGVSSTYTTGDSVPVDITLDTGGQAASGASVTVDFSGLTYSSYSATSSVFDTETAAPTLNGPSLTFSRTSSGSGYTGSAGEVLHLVFTATSAGDASLSIDETNSSVTAESDSTDILNTVGDPTTLTINDTGDAFTATPTPSPESTDTPAASLADTGSDLTWPLTISSLVIVLLCLTQLRRQRD